ncbi:MAG TPA: peptidylprolyl isomerase [Tepidisphaeraceae bacterium]|nr:peptidylprolyl isomerase [Tepidisphaeraceae bacterium]
MQSLATSIVLFSILLPSKMWYAPNQPLTVTVETEGTVALILTDFTGRPPTEIEKGLNGQAISSRYVQGGQPVDIRTIFPAALRTPGTYVLFAVKGKEMANFLGTPLVIEVRTDTRAGAPQGPMTYKVSPLRYASIETDQGPMTVAFFYDVAPNTVASFLQLAQGGFYDGLTFHRIVPDFVIQGGDPRGDGTGGPGYHVEAEFSDRKHVEGVLSMARNGDPLEMQGIKPRYEYANSAGSQFFICLGRTEHLDSRYTAFGQVVQGLEAVRAIAKTPLADTRAGRPEKAPVIKRISVHLVTAAENPYPTIMTNWKMASVPETQPAQ